MLISHEHRFIFVHIPKTGGTSITAALRPFARSGWRSRLGERLDKRTRRTLAKLHLLYLDPQPFKQHARAEQIARKLGAASFSSFFSFAFVRNPWEREVSFYEFSFSYPPGGFISEHLGSFDRYIRWRCDGNLRHQADYVCAKDGTSLVSFVGRFEDLDKDFARAADKIGVPAVLPRLNVLSRGPYQQYYTDETREMVAACFARDIERFGYTFEGRAAGSRAA